MTTRIVASGKIIIVPQSLFKNLKILDLGYTLAVEIQKGIQAVTEKSALILTDNRTHQKQQFFSLPFWRKTLRNGLKK
jgi:hypothetical protein